MTAGAASGLALAILLLGASGCASSGPYWSPEDQGAAEASELRERIASLEAQLAAADVRSHALQAKADALERDVERLRGMGGAPEAVSLPVPEAAEGLATLPDPATPSAPENPETVPVPRQRSGIEQSDLELDELDELDEVRRTSRGCSTSAAWSSWSRGACPRPKRGSPVSWPPTLTPTSRTTRSSGSPKAPCAEETSPPLWPASALWWRTIPKPTRSRTHCSKSVPACPRSASRSPPRRSTASSWRDSPRPPRQRPRASVSAPCKGSPDPLLARC